MYSSWMASISHCAHCGRALALGQGIHAPRDGSLLCESCFAQLYRHPPMPAGASPYHAYTQGVRQAPPPSPGSSGMQGHTTQQVVGGAFWAFGVWFPLGWWAPGAGPFIWWFGHALAQQATQSSNSTNTQAAHQATQSTQFSMPNTGGTHTSKPPTLPNLLTTQHTYPIQSPVHVPAVPPTIVYKPPTTFGGKPPTTFGLKPPTTG